MDLAIPFNTTDQAPGTGENGGIWPALTYPLVWGLTLVDKNMALDEWMKNSLAYEAEKYPDFWAGIWSGDDAVDSVLAEHPGWPHYPDFPILCMHRHAYPLFTAAKLVGLNFVPEGVDIVPAMPDSIATYSFHSKHVSIEKTSAGYSGHYLPLKYGSWRVRLQVTDDERRQAKLTVNGNGVELITDKDGFLSFVEKGGENIPISWNVVSNKEK